MNISRFKLTPVFAAVLGTVALLSACGGDDTEDTLQPTTVDVTTTVIDGALRNATVCLDKNDNGACDVGEPSARTAADGTATLKVAPDDAGKYPLLALVGTDAVDAEHGAVTTAYSLSTPADKAAVVSPLTTLVKAQMGEAGLSSAAAAKLLTDVVGAGSDPAALFADYTKGTDATSQGNAAVARLVVLAKQQAGTALASAIGKADIGGGTISSTDVDRAVNARLVALLPSLVDASTGSAVSGASTPAAKEAALNAAATSLVNTELALTVDSLAVVVGTAKAPEPAGTAAPAAGATLAWLTFTDANNWYYRYFASTAAQNTPDAAGRLRYTDNRKRNVAGTVEVWGASPNWTRTDAYFAGGAWAVCPTDFENESTPRNAAGQSESFYCNNAYYSKSVRSSIDITGKTMADVVSSIRAYPLPSTQGSYPSWGPAPSLLGTAVFPADAKLLYQTSTQLSTPDAYNTLASNAVRSYSADITAGGTPTYDANGVASLACGNVTAANSAALTFEVGTLEQLAAGNPGHPCNFTPNASTGPRHEWWSNSTISIGQVAIPAPALAFYRAARNIRVAFGAGSSVTYYGCAVRNSDGSTRNCDAIGSGSYSIETVGDGRVMRFAGVPAEAAALTYNRIFVERGGKVYYGYRDKLRVDNAVRLNAQGMDALFGQLNLTR